MTKGGGTNKEDKRSQCLEFAANVADRQQKCWIDSLQAVRRIGQPATSLCWPEPMEYQSATTGKHLEKVLEMKTLQKLT